MNARRMITALLCLLVLGIGAGAQGQQSTSLYTNTSGYDNGAALNELLATARSAVVIEGGIYYHQTPIIVKDDGTAIYGAAMTRWRRKGAVKEPAVVFIYNGPPDKPAWIISADGLVMRGINIWRDFYDGPNIWQKVAKENAAIAESNKTAEVKKPLIPPAVGIEFRDWGRRTIECASYCGWDTAWRFAPSNHNDCSAFTMLDFNGNRVDVRGEESQSSAIDWRSIFIHGAGETSLDLSKGGNYSFTNFNINEPRLLLRLREVSSNTCTYTFDNLKVDNNAARWRLLQMDRPGPINLIVRGQVGQDAKMGEKPIVIPDAATKRFTPPTNYQHIDIALWGPNPNPDRGVLWVPTLGECRP
jgi:hypothetical protein